MRQDKKHWLIWHFNWVRWRFLNQQFTITGITQLDYLTFCILFFSRTHRCFQRLPWEATPPTAAYMELQHLITTNCQQHPYYFKCPVPNSNSVAGHCTATVALLYDTKTFNCSMTAVSAKKVKRIKESKKVLKTNWENQR